MTSINYKIAQILLHEGADYICKGDFYKSYRVLVIELNITDKEALDILYNCPTYKEVHYAIKIHLDEFGT